MSEKATLIDLLRRISKGDQDAFRLFYDNQYPKINRFVSYQIKSREVKEEVVSDVFVIIWQQRERLNDVEDFNSFLFTIARNRSLDYIRRSEHSLVMDMIPLGLVSLENSPEDQLLTKELEEKIINAVDALPDRCKLIFLMAKEQGLKYREIAQILDISEKTVNAQMVIALKKLNAALDKYIKTVLLCLPFEAL